MHRNISLALAGPLFAACVVLAAGAADPPEQAPADQQIPPEIVARMSQAFSGAQTPEDEDLPPFDKISKGYEKVISTADGQQSLYTVWTRAKDGQMLAELPRNFEQQKLFVAYTIAGGTLTAGVQTGDMYAYWKRFDKRLALIQPNYTVRTTGDLESQKGRERVFTDRVILDAPIAAMGPNGGPVIDMDQLLVGQAPKFFGRVAMGAQQTLAKIAKAKAFPENVELAFELPLASGQLTTLHYSVSSLPANTGYRTREADGRIGYFTTTFRDIGDPGKDTPWVRYINRWKLEKADPKLKMSPPKEPIVFYLEHTIPVRYRRWVRDGVLEWNKAFEKVGLVNAVEVYQQDARTGAHMEKDPEDARYNFVLWTNANMGFAIGPSRVHPETGQILDADIVMDEGFITSWINAWKKIVPEVAMQNFDPQTLAWLQTRPQWDPRVRLASPADRPQIIDQLTRSRWENFGEPFAGHSAAGSDPTLLGDDPFDGLRGRISQVNGRCDHAQSCAMELALFRLAPDLLIDLAETAGRPEDDDEDDQEGSEGDETDEDEAEESDEDEGEASKEGEDEESEEDAEAEDEEEESPEQPEKPAEHQMLDGVPEWFIGPLLKDVVMHEVGHTLGLRHNFKASSIYGLDEVNCEGMKGQAITGSVMDYNPININFEDGEVQGEYTMITIGPYDYWAIEYGYSHENDLKPVLQRVSEAGLAYATDEDTWSSDPLARRFDFGKNSLDYAQSQMRLVKHLREKILDRMVKEGESWAKAREGYDLLLSRHFSNVALAANWIGGAFAVRDFKGDPGDRAPVTPVPADQQRRALDFVIDNAFDDSSFGLTQELMSKMTVDKWWDDGGFSSIFEDPAYPVHERIMGIQAAALTMLMNPTTLNRVYDNEFRIATDEDALTLPEIIHGVSDSVWSELDEADDDKYTSRKPMISSLRRNLQREHLERLIDLSLPNDGFGVALKPVQNLSTFKLRDLKAKIEGALDGRAKTIDPYTLAHLTEAKVRIEKALDAQYIYNTDDLAQPAMMPPRFFGENGQPSGQ